VRTRPLILLSICVTLAGCRVGAEVLSTQEDDAGVEIDAADAFVDLGGYEGARVMASAGEDHTCAIRAGELSCWGDNAVGQLGLGDRDPRASPARVGGADDWVEVSAGQGFGCGLDQRGRVWCWGQNDRGQLGQGDDVVRDAPTPVPLILAADLVRASFSHACAILGIGSLYCWGANGRGQLGRGNLSDGFSVPEQVGAQIDWFDVCVGESHTCGLRADGELWCWGDAAAAQLGAPASADPVTTPRRAQPARRFASLVCGASHTCAQDAQGELSCWGENDSGRLVAQSPALIEAPARVSLGGVSAFGTRGRSHCAVATGLGYCWGANEAGQLGLGDRDPRVAPTPLLDAPTDLTGVTVGAFHACFWRDVDAGLWCVGANDAGQLGLGDMVQRADLARVF
jgi:hypothetical protein